MSVLRNRILQAYNGVKITVIPLNFYSLNYKFPVKCVEGPLTDGEGSQLLTNGEEKLAERMVKDSEPRKSLGGF